VEPVLRQIVLLEQYYETDENLLGLCGQAAGLFQKFGIDQITDDLLMNEFTLNVNVGMGATNPQEQVQQFISGMQALRDILADGSLMGLGLKVDEVITELFGKLGYKDGSRFFELEQQDPQIAQMQQTIDQLKADLEKKMPQELLEATIRRIDAEIASMGVRDKVGNAEAVKKGSEAQFSAMQTAEVIAAVPAVAPIADELMKAAGYVVPTPNGVDPNFPQPAMPDAGLGIEAVKNRRTGVGFMPGTPDLPSPSTTLRPAMPTPADSNTGQRQGIQTVRPDSIAGAAFADGGLVPAPEDDLTSYSHRGAYVGQPIQHDANPDQLAQMARALNQNGGAFINADGQEDNLNGYNLAAVGMAPDALNTSQVHSGLSSAAFNTGAMDKGSTVRSLLGESAFNRYADGGVISGPGTGTSDSIAAVAAGQPLAVSNGEYHVPAAVVQALGEDFFERLIQEFHQPSGTPDSAMPVTSDPLAMEPGDFVVPADVVEALGQDFFDHLVAMYGGKQ
jgi:hypothetical protein